MQTKVCTKCGIEKEISEFHKQKAGKFGVQPKCKLCDKKYSETYYKSHIEERNVYNELNKDYKKEYDRKRNIKNREKNKNQRLLFPEKTRNTQLKSKYGITLEQYQLMFKEQNGVCAICGQPEVAIDKRTNIIKLLAVDHDHQTGKVRGLLCQKCNHGIGNFNDNQVNLQLAIQYLNNHKD
jgi:hypothetical protein